MKLWALVSALVLAAAASGEHEEEGGDRTGPGKAVLEASAERGMRLSEPASKRIGVKTVPVGKEPVHRLPVAALVVSEEEVGVYRLREGWFKHVDVEVVSRERGSAVVRSGDLAAGDRVVVAGAPLLRVAELDVLGGEGADHGH